MDGFPKMASSAKRLYAGGSYMVNPGVVNHAACGSACYCPEWRDSKAGVFKPSTMDVSGRFFNAERIALVDRWIATHDLAV